METLILTVGVPRSGKSTWCKKMIKEKGYVVVNPDSIRLSLHGDTYNPRKEKEVWKIVDVMIKSLFLAGHDTIILDATNIICRRRKKWSKKYELKYKLFNFDVNTCIERAKNDNREDLIPVIIRMAEHFQPLDEVEKKHLLD